MIDIGNAAQLGSFIIACAAFAYTWFSARKRDNSTEINQIKGALETRAGKGSVDNLEKRTRANEEAITRLNAEFAHLPDKEMTHRLEMSMARLQGQMETMGASLKPIAAISERLQEFLLEQAAHK